MSDNQQLIEAKAMQEASVKLKEVILAPNDTQKLAREQELIAILNKNESLWDRLFPSKAKKLNRDEAIRQLKQLTDNRMEAVQLYHDTYMAAAREQADFYIKGLSVNLHSQLTEFVTQEFKKTQKTISEQSRETIVGLKSKYDELDNIYGSDDNMFKSAEKEILNKQLEVHLTVTKKLVDGIQVALEKRAQVLIQVN